MLASTKFYRVLVFLSAVSLISIMHRYIWTSSQRPRVGNKLYQQAKTPPFVIIANLSGDPLRLNAIQTTWFKEDSRIGLLAMGVTENSFITCNSPLIRTNNDNDAFINTKRAFLQAARCFPSARYVGKLNDENASLDLLKFIENIEIAERNSNESTPDYYGYPQMVDGLRYATGKAGYFLSRSAIILLENCIPSHRWAQWEDTAIGECMIRNGINLTFIPGLQATSPSFQFPLVESNNTEYNSQDPDLCVVITFRESDDPLKNVAHQNTADVYASLRPRVRTFLVHPVPSEAFNLSLETLDAPKTNSHGTPLLVSLLERVEAACPKVPFLAYVNSDILFDTGILQTIDALLNWNQPDMLAVGQRSNHDLKGVLSIHEVPRVQSELFTPVAQDYFIVTRGLLDRWRSLPPYVIGRRGYDNALVDWAYHNSILVDLTGTVLALHQTTSDGNFAGHSPRNPDQEYNVQLPDAVYDHGSTGHAHYVTSTRDGEVVIIQKNDNRIVARSSGSEIDNILSLKLTSRGRVVGVDALKSPLFVAFGNDAYKEMLASFLCNLALFPPMLSHTLIIVTDQNTAKYLESLDTDAIIGLHPNDIQTGHDYGTKEYVRLMLLRGRILLQLLGSRVVVWLEADAEYSGNLLENPQISSAATDLVLYWDGTMYGGGFIRFAATDAAKKFYSEIVSRLEAGVAREDFSNDQELLNSLLANTTASREEFDRCAFRSGIFYHPEHGTEYRAICKGKRPLVQQHNWVIGNQRKIEMAKQNGGWFLGATSPFPVCSQRDLRVMVMTMNRPASLERLLLSLRNAAYPTNARIDVRVSVDKLPNQEHDSTTTALLREFEWPHGVFEVLLWPEPVGIFGQWVDSWPCELYRSDLYRAVLLLEDDLEVSTVYHEWFIGAHTSYAATDMGAVTGMRAQLVALHGASLSASELVPKGVQVFAYRLIATW